MFVMLVFCYLVNEQIVAKVTCWATNWLIEVCGEIKA